MSALPPAAQPLQQALARIIPGAALELFTLPDTPQIRLALLQADYPQGELDAEAIGRIMDHPLYWSFCWASGQVLAAYLLENPALVAGKRVLDFGCGSGVVAIAAALAGAGEVIACDIDPLAVAATRLNAGLNNCQLEVVGDYGLVDGALDLIIVADVLYDSANLPWLEEFTRRAPRTLVADSRVKDFDFPPYHPVERRDSCTLPDLDESAHFRDVRIYRNW